MNTIIDLRAGHFARRFLSLTFFAFLFISLNSRAATLYWDSDADASGNDVATGTNLGGTGTWNTSLANWFNGSVETIWNNANNDAAVFDGGSGTVTLGGPITAGSLSFSNNTGSYDITADTLTLSSGVIDSGASNHTVSSIITGASGLTKLGAGALTLSGA